MKEKEVRIYKSYNYPLDPSKIILIGDMDFSYALAETLVRWSDSKQVIAGVASKWKKAGEKKYQFSISEKAKWSDGTRITGLQVKDSLLSAFKRHPEDLRSLKELVEKITVPEPFLVEFHLNSHVDSSNLLGKLTEPQFGILSLNDGKIELNKTSGPYYVLKHSSDDVHLSKNKHGLDNSEKMPETIWVKQPDSERFEESSFLKDSWSNVLETSSLIDNDTEKQMERENVQFWRRPIDKVMILKMSRTAFQGNGRSIVKYLRANLKMEKLLSGLSGFRETNQMFPRGYQLHNRDFECSQPKDRPKLTKLKILYSPNRTMKAFRDNLGKEIERLFQITPDFESISLSNVKKRMMASDYDFYLGTLGMADPDPEGIMSFYFEGKLPMILSNKGDMVARLDKVRELTDDEVKVREMSKIVTDSVCDGRILPLFHLSTVGLAKFPIDISNIPVSEESLTFARIRLRN